jgi:hypothetical protein
MTELHRQVRLALKGLFPLVLQDLVVEYIPVVKIYCPGGILHLILSWLDSNWKETRVRFIGTTIDWNLHAQYTRKPRKNEDKREWAIARWSVGKQDVTARHPNPDWWKKGGYRLYGHPVNPEFNCTVDFNGFAIPNRHKSHTVEIDPDLNKVLRVIEHDGITPPT